MAKYNYPNWHEIKTLAMIYCEAHWDDAEVVVWNPNEQQKYNLWFCGSSRPEQNKKGCINFIISPQIDVEKHEDVYFISGHRDVTDEEFEKWYVPKIHEVLVKNRNAKFIVGDYGGVDIMAQNYLAKINHAHSVTVCHMFDSPRHINDDVRTLGNLIGGFVSDEERDAYMTEHSCEDIAFVREGKRDSGTAQNIVRRYEKLKK